MKYFKIQELVSKEIYDEFGEDSLLQFKSDKALNSLFALRALIGLPITVNNWHIGGQFNNRGLRTQDCKVGAKNSAHKKGLAFDIDVKGMKAEEVRQFILAHQKELPFITRLESDVNWCHFDCVYTGKNQITMFKP